MSASLFHRRRAERLAQLLDEANVRPRHHTRSTIDPQLSGYVRLGTALPHTSAALSGPSTDFRDSLRAMLVATAERDGIGATAVDSDAPEIGKRARVSQPVVGSKRARGAILVGLAAGTLALSGMSAASTDAMPGDALYGMKRSTESARLALAGSDVSRGQLYLDFARNRLDEAESVGGGGTGLATMLDDMDNETRAGTRLLTTLAASRREHGPLDLIDGFVHTQQTRLIQLGDSARVLQSLALLDRIALRSAGLRSNLSCTAEATDDLGPVTPACKGNPGGTRGGGAPAGTTGTGTGSAPHGESGPAGSGATHQPAGGTGTGAATSPTPSPSPSGLLDGVGRLIGGR